MRVEEDRKSPGEHDDARGSGAWHSSKARVHHNNPRCTSGRMIGGRNRRPGDGRKPLCEQCQVLNQYG
jgi:hypothetical protein